MTTVLNGKWFDGSTSAGTEVQCWVEASGEVSVFRSDDKQALYRGSFRDLDISSRLGNTPRYLSFPERQKLETRDNDSVDQVQRSLSGGSGGGLIHRLESQWHFILLSLVVVLAFGWGMVRYGVPETARLIAAQLPDAVLDFATEQTVNGLDKALFEPSELSDQQRQQWLQAFAPLQAQYPFLKIEFRDGYLMGPNALALPNGTVIFTDQMIRLAEDPNELIAVMAHEVAHVQHNHGMRSVIQDSLLAFMLLLVTGDSSATAEIFLALPVVLTEMAYSRGFESEADDFALAYLQDKGIEPHHFANLMQRLERQAGCIQENRQGIAEQLEAQLPEEELTRKRLATALETHCMEVLAGSASALLEQGDSNGESRKSEVLDWRSYLGTHPATAERIEKFR